MQHTGYRIHIAIAVCSVLLTLIPSIDCDANLQQCSNQLEYGVDYPLELDLPEQRAALLSIYNSTGGNNWSFSDDEFLHELFFELIDDVIEYGDSLSGDSIQNASSILAASRFKDLAALPSLSGNCTLQQSLSFGQLLLDHTWGELDRSYCTWQGITCCKTAGDALSQYCTAPQSVAYVYLPDNNMSGSIPEHVFPALPDLQSLTVSDNPGLGGRLPDFGKGIASKMSLLRISNTSLQQCDASHLAVYTGGLVNKQLRAGSSDSIGADNQTGCLPDGLLFCEMEQVGESPLYCPSVAFRRPVQKPANQLDLVESMLEVLAATDSLVQAAAYLTPDMVNLTWPAAAVACGSDDSSSEAFSVDGGLGRDDVTIDYDQSLFSYVGCRCQSGYDNIYTFDEAGRVTLQCSPAKTNRQLVIAMVASMVPFTVIAALCLLVAMHWQRILAELAQIQINRVKRGNIPGMMSPALAQEMGLVHKEITLVMTDVQASSKLWEWDARVMDQALSMHDACLRSVLHQYCGYEVATEGDAFTMAFHDPIDAISWCLEVQQQLTALPWPAEILTQPDSAVHNSPDPAFRDLAIFKGLRVRMAIHTGKPDSVQAHHVTRQVEYKGGVISLTEALVGFPAGGQVLLSDATYQRIYGRLHTVNFQDQLKKQQERRASRLSNFAAAIGARPAPLAGIDIAVMQDTVEQSAGSASTLPAHMSLSKPLSPAPSAQLLLPGSPTVSTKRLAWEEGRTGTTVRRLPSQLESPHRTAQDATQPPGKKPLSFTALLQAMRHSVMRWILCGRNQAQTQGSILGRMRPLPTDTSSAVRSTAGQRATCELIDMGAFYLAEFANKQCCPIEGSAVHGGLHVLQVVAPSHMGRLLCFPSLSQTSKVAPSFGDAPGVRAVKHALEEDGLHRLPNLTATLVFCGPSQYKELLAHNVFLAQTALLQFQSCIRTTLLLSNGYECQEKEGLFMIAFPSPRGAVEWALLLQLALLRVNWSPELEQHAATAEVKSSQGHTLFKGLTAKVALVHGNLEKVCPHTSTGRADYFGSTVNRAARLLCAAKSGQILAEAPVTEAVLKEWMGTDLSSLTAPLKTRGSGLLGSGGFTLPADDITSSADMSAAPKAVRNRTAPNLLTRIDSSNDWGSTADKDRGGSAVTSSGVDLEANSRVSSLIQSAGLPPRPAVGIWAKSFKQGVHFAAGGPQVEKASLPQRMIPKKSADGGVSYEDEELETLDISESSCQPFAADSPLAVSNCHMLKFYAQTGRQKARQDSGLVREGSTAEELVAEGNSQKVGNRFASVVAKVKDMQRAEGESGAPVQTKPVPALDRCLREAKRPIWTPNSAKGKPFPTCQVPIEVWGIGAFKFKGIAGQSKVMEVQVAELAERMTLHSTTLEPGKAVCVLAAQYRRCSINIHLMDVLDLQLSL